MAAVDPKDLPALHSEARAACERAIAKGYEYIAFLWTKERKIKLIASRNGHYGRSSFRFDFDLETWAVNVVYRLQEERFLGVPWEEVEKFFDELEENDGTR